MNENNFLEKYPDYQVKPLQKVMNYIITGFIFSGFSIQHSILPEINAMISALCFYFGLRMIKKENRYLFVSYMISIVFVVMSIMSFIVRATPFHFPLYISYLFAILKTIEIVCMCFGFEHFILNKRYIYYFIIVYILMIGLVFLGSSSMFISTLYLILFLVLIRILFKIKEDIVENKYDVQFSLVKVDAWKVTLIYIICAILCVRTTMCVLPLQMYKYTDETLQDYSHLTLLDQKKLDQIKMNEENKNEKTNKDVMGYIYDYDENFFLYVYELEMNLDKKYSAFDVELEFGLSNRIKPQTEVLSFVVSDDIKSYKCEKKASNYINKPFSIAFYHIPIDPDVKSITIQLAVKIDKLKAYGEEYLDSLGESILRVYGYNYLVYPYREPVEIASYVSHSIGYQWENFEE